MTPDALPSTPQQRLTALGLLLPPAPKPIGAYVPSLALGNFLYCSGHLPLLPDGGLIKGRVGADLDADAGRAAARQVALALLASVIAAVGSLDRVRRVVKVLGMVQCTPEFEQHPQVLNGCSELFAELWGREAGIGVRSAVGVASLPSGVAVEIEALFELAAD
ncbi:MAG: RidA family protein [Planctomycetia bacterium]